MGVQGEEENIPGRSNSLSKDSWDKNSTEGGVPFWSAGGQWLRFIGTYPERCKRAGHGMAGLLGQVRTRAVDGDGRAHVFCFASVGRRRLEATSER